MRPFSEMLAVASLKRPAFTEAGSLCAAKAARRDALGSAHSVIKVEPPVAAIRSEIPSKNRMSAMSIQGKPISDARREEKAARGFDLRLAIAAVALLATVSALLVDRDGVVSGLARIGHGVESGLRVIASVDQPF